MRSVKQHKERIPRSGIPVEGIEITSEFVFKDSFLDFMNTVETGRSGVFGLSNISITNERKKLYSFSPSYMDNVSLLLTNKNVKTLINLENIKEEFNGMTAYSLPSSSYLNRLTEIKKKYHPSLKIITLSTEAELIDKLVNDENSFAILDANNYLEVLKKGYNIKRHRAGDKKDDQFGIIMPKNSDWEPLINDFFNSELIETAKYSQIISDNLGATALRLIKSIK